MSSLSADALQAYLSRSISSLNRNKLNGILAEIDFRTYLASLGFADRISAGGWIARSEGPGSFAHHTAVFFPETIEIGRAYPVGRTLPDPALGLHTICSTFHQLGIHSYFCSPTVHLSDEPLSVTWDAMQLGLPTRHQYEPFPGCMRGFSRRPSRYNFLRYSTDAGSIPDAFLADQFSKENVRVVFQTTLLSELSDIDGILWGQQYTYPLEIKEKTCATSPRMGDYFGLDLGPFIKLAFYAAKRGNLHSIFVVREIDDQSTRELIGWWYIEFDRMAQYASWIPQGGGTSMQGTRSTVVKIPKAEFTALDRNALNEL